MSIRLRGCGNCQVDLAFDGLRLGPQRPPSAYGVGWRCPQCAEGTVDVCPMGPILPTPTACLNCGGALPLRSVAACPRCGLTHDETRSLLGIRTEWSTEVALQAARDAFARGLCRRGLGIVNYVLQRDPTAVSAWEIKYQFYQMLGVDPLTLQEVDQASARTVARGGWM